MCMQKHKKKKNNNNNDIIETEKYYGNELRR